MNSPLFLPAPATLNHSAGTLVDHKDRAGREIIGFILNQESHLQVAPPSSRGRDEGCLTQYRTVLCGSYNEIVNRPITAQLLEPGLFQYAGRGSKS